jgi:Domain of unknown function (DUF4296)
MKYFFYIAICMLFAGCQDIKRPEKPKDLIPEDTMAALLSEIYLGNAARSIDNKTMRKSGIKIDSFLFKKYNVDSLQFAKSNAYYASDLDAYNAIFQKIERKLETLKNEESERKLREDSIRKAQKKVNDTTKLKELEETIEKIDTAKTERRLLIDSAISEQ